MNPDPLMPGRMNLLSLFGNTRPVEVDVGCGKGLFLAQEGAARPHVNFIGVDRLSRKVSRTLRRIGERRLGNVRVFRCGVFHFVDRILPEESISVFHIYFPDPWPKNKHAKRRFFDAAFVASVAVALLPGGTVWLSTDQRDYYETILDLFAEEPAFRRLYREKGAGSSVTDFEEEFVEMQVPILRAGFKKGVVPAIRPRAPR